MSRKALDAELRTFGIDNVYFQPPPNLQMVYDCFVYELSDIHTNNADDMTYRLLHRYQVTLVTRKYNEELIDTIMHHFNRITFARPYRSDNLYHTVFYIYY